MIASGNYDIDIHNPEGGGSSHYYFPEGQYYTIPYRVGCLGEAAGTAVALAKSAKAGISEIAINALQEKLLP